MNQKDKDLKAKYQTPLPAFLANLEKEVDEKLNLKPDEGEQKPKEVVIHNPDLEKKDETSEKPVESDSQAQDEEAYKVKYEVLEKKFSSQDSSQKRQISDLQTQVATLQGTVQNLNDLLIQTRSDNLKRDKETEKEPDEDLTFAPDQDLEEEYGPEMVKLVKALKKQNETIDLLRNELNDKSQKLDTIDRTVQVSEEDRRVQSDRAKELEIQQKYCKDFIELQHSDDFATWLNSDQWRKDQAVRYFTEGNLAAVGSIANQFIQETGWKPTGGNGKSRAAELEEQVIPDTASSSATLKNDKSFQRVSQAQYDKAFSEYRAGNMSEAEFDKILINYKKTIQEARGLGRA